MTPYRFNVAALVPLLDAAITEHGRIDVSPDGHVWLFPSGAGSAIHLHVFDDECDVDAGLTFHVTIAAGEDANEELIVDCVLAIIGGKAEEYYAIGASTGAGRFSHAVGVSFTGDVFSISNPVPAGAVRRPIPAWASMQ